MKYITPEFIEAYTRADVDERKKMLRTILEAWDTEYHNLIRSGVSPDTVWDLGNRQLGGTIGSSGVVQSN